MGSSVHSLGYFLFEVSDLDAWDHFLTKVIGAERGEALGEELVPYRTDDRAARILLKQGPADDLIALGFEVPSEQSLHEVAKRVRDAGYAAETGSESEAVARGVEGFVRTFEPGGVAVELFYEPALGSAPFRRDEVAAGFITGEQGIGHLALRADDISQTRTYFEQVLSFTLSDHIRCTLPGDFKVDVTFLHVNPRHHTVALGSGLPKHLHHFMLQMGSLDDVGAALDRAFANGVRVVQGLGRHPNDQMVTFYCVTPSGFECEVGWGGRTVDDSTWEPTTYDRISDWGHHSPYRRAPIRPTEMGEQP
ncbi:MAG: 2,3-dihydroxybiphenyl 1,2-dioxygenase [Myxococcales bacterium]|nr:MAG: 2,3-dihydroxybiphenyl 1,2-dioxygenase [Myxococcales bacterium]